MARRAIGPQEGGSNRGEKAAVDISVIDLREQSVATSNVALAPPKGSRVPFKFDKRTGRYRGTASPGRYICLGCEPRHRAAGASHGRSAGRRSRSAPSSALPDCLFITAAACGFRSSLGPISSRWCFARLGRMRTWNRRGEALGLEPGRDFRRDSSGPRSSLQAPTCALRRASRRGHSPPAGRPERRARRIRGRRPGAIDFVPDRRADRQVRAVRHRGSDPPHGCGVPARDPALGSLFAKHLAPACARRSGVPAARCRGTPCCTRYRRLGRNRISSRPQSRMRSCRPISSGMASGIGSSWIVPDAWQALQDAGLQAFVLSPTIIIATVDQGIESAGGVPVNPEFQGNVSNGSTKTYRLFDFINLVADNDNPIGSHGMGVAGVCGARADNPSPVAGVGGWAGGCRAEHADHGAGSFRRATSTSRTCTSGRPGSTRAARASAFPPPSLPGLTSSPWSIGFGSGAPISGTAMAMLDYLTHVRSRRQGVPLLLLDRKPQHEHFPYSSAVGRVRAFDRDCRVDAGRRRHDRDPRAHERLGDEHPVLRAKPSRRGSQSACDLPHPFVRARRSAPRSSGTPPHRRC